MRRCLLRRCSPLLAAFLAPRQVLACPPAACLDVGCPGHEFATKGLAGCLDTFAAVGTVFRVPYVVLDSAVPPNMATAERLVTLVSPCEEEENYCEAAPGDWECTTLACAALVQTRALGYTGAGGDTLPPVVTLLGGTELVSGLIVFR